jgi:hypothetical protein
MEARLKAEELLQKMDVIHYVKLYGKNKDSKGLPVSMHNDQIKQCALIAVDEMIYETQFEVPNVRQKYWMDVKHEIEKL